MSWSLTRRAIAVCAIAAVIAFLFNAFGKNIHRMSKRMEEEVRRAGDLGPAIIFAMALVTSLPIPVYNIMLMFAGYVFGFGSIILVTFLGSLAGSTLVFLLCRRCCSQDFFARYIPHNSRWRPMVEASSGNGFKIVCLLRIIPFPFAVLNIAAAALPISSVAFVLANALTIPFKQVIYIYIGSSCSNLIEVLGKGNSTSSLSSRLVQQFDLTSAARLLMVLTIFVAASLYGRKHLKKMYQTSQHPHAGHDLRNEKELS
ncbi:hypothetical protein GUITHDRAFT_108369 [Guillardia theta CCMP2712]|uniref:VTT domain-containing protein n=1 Tax=Guillardia theta (strain CCMP2712) TaxID=905079 RepID=L1JBK7_GUITC|nr:hypothetical protein GUITHDRAFT_108369 [Guillardia theta CCMP2712]EKX45918.1 hypothetical protein GUITHDRAFT_108369 [Guillardia theta CCMP2712]|eukprot:XP_005832898.1 hypothetical protein GUITHDRAFT_108369 [Guillardia theta CCMP2712]